MFVFWIWLLFISTGSGSNNWLHLNSKCLQVNNQTATHANATLYCQKLNASLYSAKDENELNSLSKLLNTKNDYWTSAKSEGQIYKWEDGRSCCPSGWWGYGEPNQENSCVRLKLNYLTWRFFDRECNYKFQSICAKNGVRFWKHLQWNDLQGLCGVEIMPNCGGLACKDVCQSHHDCDQFGEMANLCVNMKYVSQIDNCIVKLSPKLKLYRLELDC